MYYLALLLHFAIIIAAYSSPFIVDWKVILLGAIVYYPISNYLKYCPLTKYQFGNTKHSFNWYYLSKVGINIKEETLNKYLMYVMPLVVIAIAMYWQIILGNEVLISL